MGCLWDQTRGSQVFLFLRLCVYPGSPIARGILRTWSQLAAPTRHCLRTVKAQAISLARPPSHARFQPFGFTGYCGLLPDVADPPDSDGKDFLGASRQWIGKGASSRSQPLESKPARCSSHASPFVAGLPLSRRLGLLSRELAGSLRPFQDLFAPGPGASPAWSSGCDSVCSSFRQRKPPSCTC